MNNEIDPIKELVEQLSGEPCAKWSEWHRYCGNENELERLIPDVPGIYEFRVREFMFGRFHGETDIVYIGRTGSNTKAGGSLRKRIVFREHTGAMKWMKTFGHEFDVRWLPLQSDDGAEVAEQWDIKKYIREHGETPPGQRGEGGTDPESCEYIKIKRGDRPLRWRWSHNLMETLESAQTLL